MPGTSTRGTLYAYSVSISNIMCVVSYTYDLCELSISTVQNEINTCKNGAKLFGFKIQCTSLSRGVVRKNESGNSKREEMVEREKLEKLNNKYVPCPVPII